jgi:hypothetical protein
MERSWFVRADAVWRDRDLPSQPVPALVVWFPPAGSPAGRTLCAGTFSKFPSGLSSLSLFYSVAELANLQFRSKIRNGVALEPTDEARRVTQLLRESDLHRRPRSPIRSSSPLKICDRSAGLTLQSTALVDTKHHSLLRGFAGVDKASSQVRLLISQLGRGFVSKQRATDVTTRSARRQD